MQTVRARLSDELARRMAERARQLGAPRHRVLQNAVKHYLESAEATAAGSSSKDWGRYKRCLQTLKCPLDCCPIEKIPADQCPHETCPHGGCPAWFCEL